MAARTKNPSRLSIATKKETELFGERPTGLWTLIDDVTTTGDSLRRAIKLIGDLLPIE